MKYNIEKINEDENQVEYTVRFKSPELYRKALYTSYLKFRREFIDDLNQRPSFESILYEEFSDNGERLDEAVISEYFYDITGQIEEDFGLDNPDIYVTNIEYEKDEESGLQIPVVKMTELKFPELNYDNYKDYLPEDLEDEKSMMEIQIEAIRALSELREQNVRLVPSEESVKPDSLVNATILKGEEGEEVDTLDFGSNSPDSEQIGVTEFGLIGSKPEEVVEVNELANAYFQQLYGPEKYSIRINQVYDKEYPEVDDEFAAEVSEFDSLEELQKSLTDSILEEELEKKNGMAFYEALSHILRENTSVFEENLNGIVPAVENTVPTQIITNYMPKIFQDVTNFSRNEVSGSLYTKVANEFARVIVKEESDLLDDKDQEKIDEKVDEVLDDNLFDTFTDEQKEKIRENQRNVQAAQRIVGKLMRGESSENSPETEGE